MENPFEIINQRLERIESLLESINLNLSNKKKLPTFKIDKSKNKLPDFTAEDSLRYFLENHIKKSPLK